MKNQTPRPSNASPTTLPATMPPIAPPLKPSLGSGLSIEEVVSVSVSVSVTKVAVLVEAMISAGSKLKYVAEGLAELSDEYRSLRTEDPISGSGFLTLPSSE